MAPETLGRRDVICLIHLRLDPARDVKQLHTLGRKTVVRQIRNLLVHYIHDREVVRAAKKYLCGRLIDIGCGTKPFRQVLSSLVTEHIGIDHSGTLHGPKDVDLWGTAYRIPADDQSFDSVLCTSVMEHLEEPEVALRECHRLLRAGGYALYTVPFIWHLHEEPRDFFRFSRYGLKYLFEKVGFEIVEINALSGFWGTFGQLFVYNLYRFNRGPLRWLHLVDLVGLLTQLISFGVDRIDRTEQWTLMYLVVARKKSL